MKEKRTNEANEAVEMVESETKYLKQMPTFCKTCSVHECCFVRRKKMSKEYTKKKEKQQPAVCNILWDNPSFYYEI